MRKIRLRQIRKHYTDAPTKGRLAVAAKGNPYNYRWQQQRAIYLMENPFCVMCRAKGLYVSATVVDHIIPHQGDQRLFWDKNNLQPLCAPCHDGPKQRADWRMRGGRPL